MKGSKKNEPHASLSAAALACNPCLPGFAGASLSSLPPSLHTFSLWLCPSPPSYKDSCHWLEGPPSSARPSSPSGCKELIRSKVPSQVLGVRTHFSPQHMPRAVVSLASKSPLPSKVPAPTPGLWGTGVGAEATPLTLSEGLRARAGLTVGQTLFLLFKTRSYSAGLEDLVRNAVRSPG